MSPRVKPRSAKPKTAGLQQPAPKGKRGGARPGSGPKPAAATVLKRKLQAEGVEAAEEAFALMVGWMKDPAVGIANRIACAIYVQDRVMGKPTTSIQNDANLPYLVYDVEDDDDDDDDAPEA